MFDPGDLVVYKAYPGAEGELGVVIRKANDSSVFVLYARTNTPKLTRVINLTRLPKDYY